MSLAGTLRKASVVLSGLVGMGVWKLIAMGAVARVAGAATQGGLVLLISLISAGVLTLGMGLEYANAYLVGQDRGRRPAVAANSVVVAGVAALLGAGWAWAGLVLFPQSLLVVPSLTWGVVIAAGSIGAMVLGAALQAASIGSGAFTLVARVNLIGGLVWLVGVGGGLAVDAGALSVAWLVSVAAICALYWHGLGLGWRFDPEREVAERQIGFGIRTLPGSLARFLNMRLGLYLTATFLPADEVGVYGLVMMISETLLLLPTALGQVVLGTTAEGSLEEEHHHFLLRSVAYIGALASILTWGVGASVLGRVFGPEYAEGGPVLAVLLSAVTLHSVGLVHLHRFYGGGRPLEATFAQMVAVVFTAGAGLALIPRYGMMGAAGTAVLTYGAFSAYLFFRPSPVSSDGAAT